MKPDYWLQSWSEGRIGFHHDQVNPFLIKYFDYIKPGNFRRVFVPLCGKSKDMLWLYKQGFHVTGVELSSIACENFFNENCLEYIKYDTNGLTCYQHKNIQLFCGNIFDFTPDTKFDVIYDHKSLVALPKDMWQRYVSQIIKCCSIDAVMLLVACELNSVVNEPPFSVDGNEISELYEEYFDISVLSRQRVEDVPLKLVERGCSVVWIAIYMLKTKPI